MVKVVIEVEVVGSVHIDMSMSLRDGLAEEGVMLLNVCSMDRIEIF